MAIDGVDVRKYKVRSLRERISIVLQDPVLFQGTVADNLRYGRLEATREEIEEAARAAHAPEVIARRSSRRKLRLRSSRGWRKATTRRSRSPAVGCRAASGSASASRARS